MAVRLRLKFKEGEDSGNINRIWVALFLLFYLPCTVSTTPSAFLLFLRTAERIYQEWQHKSSQHLPHQHLVHPHGTEPLVSRQEVPSDAVWCALRAIWNGTRSATQRLQQRCQVVPLATVALRHLLLAQRAVLRTDIHDPTLPCERRLTKLQWLCLLRHRRVRT